ncbi:16S rRNA (guanine(527)-N(7))-methyltransferase RsmG [Brachybacterium sp.]|uniref:16S rRNA (guanine(527)-N(7))-methyltransferase RsmG n=1 Tax=Brachybacterium sp. TaxID=1891286 RepID=UPI002ED55F0B
MLPLPESLRPTAERLFGERLELAERFVALLAEQGPERGLIGPREMERLWERHLLNCALLVDGIDAVEGPVTTLADVGSGAGLPGVVIAIARPDLQVTLIETMQRRTTWLEEVDAELGLGLEVLRARAEELHGRRSFDVVTARAVAAMEKLATWTLPLVAEGGSLLAMKGSSAAEEVESAQKVLTRLGGVDPTISQYGAGEVEVPTTVVQVRRRAKATRKGDARG